MRDIIFHEYDQLNLDIIWDVIANKLPALARLFDSLLEKM
nr:HepT-like ribonuclease domain-containing protein [Synechocystis sp. PCC 7338]